MTIKNSLKHIVLFILLLFSQTECYSNPFPSMKDSLKRIKFQTKSIIIQNTSPENVFTYMDKIRNTGAHMENQPLVLKLA